MIDRTRLARGVWTPLTALAALTAVALLAPAATGEDKAVVFPMKKVSLLEVKTTATDRAVGGAVSVRCTTVPDPAVKAYPKLTSKQPFYGTLVFDRSPYDGSAGTSRSFAIDESPEALAAKEADAVKEKAEKEKAESKGNQSKAAPAIEAKPEAKADAPVPDRKAGDAAKATKKTPVKTLVRPQGMMSRTARAETPPKCYYDRLYFDANGDGDLTNDPVIHLMKDPPASLRPAPMAAVFDPVPLPDGAGSQIAEPMRIVPVLFTYGPQYAYLGARTTHYWTGEIRIGAEEYSARLVQSASISSRFDRPFTGLFLTPKNAPKDRPARVAYSMFDTWLGTIREVGGTQYVVEASPSGDTLTVKPFDGPKGTLEISAGERKLDDLGVAGMFVSKNGGVNVGKMTYPKPEMVRRAELPAGDYMPLSLSVRFGRVSTNMRPCMERTPQGEGRYKPTYTVAIAKDKPFRLDFAEKPRVEFQNPPAGKPVKPGDTVRIEALLIDAKLGLMVAGLQDTSAVEREVDSRDMQGNTIKIPVYKTLTPTVRIVDESGKEVAGGPMPFG
jgi:hypothetical protein